MDGYVKPLYFISRVIKLMPTQITNIKNKKPTPCARQCLLSYTWCRNTILSALCVVHIYVGSGCRKCKLCRQMHLLRYNVHVLYCIVYIDAVYIFVRTSYIIFAYIIFLSCCYFMYDTVKCYFCPPIKTDAGQMADMKIQKHIHTHTQRQQQASEIRISDIKNRVMQWNGYIEFEIYSFCHIGNKY